MQKKTFSLLVFHGSARHSANEAAFCFAQKLRTGENCENFAICFLKGVVPELREALSDAVNAGYRNIKVIPLFLLPGAHITSDIPDIISDFKASHDKASEVSITLYNCLVDDFKFLQLVANTIRTD